MTNAEILKRLKEDMRLRGMSEHTVIEYAQRAGAYMKYHGEGVENLGEEHIREFLLHLKEEKKLASSTINTHSSAIRFLYGVTLNRTLNLWQIPRLKAQRRIPDILTQTEVRALIDHAPNPMYRAMFMMIYGSGLRAGEAVNLKVSDIDSEKMKVRIRNGKGGRDRFAMLSQRALEALREYWLIKKPKDDLFLSRRNQKVSIRAVQDAFNGTKKRAGIEKKATLHTLRHCFATHLLESDVNLFHIKKLMGHASIRSTAWYLHFADYAAYEAQSPLDSMLPADE